MMPSTSGRAATYPRRVDKLKFFNELKTLRDSLLQKRGPKPLTVSTSHDPLTGEPTTSTSGEVSTSDSGEKSVSSSGEKSITSSGEKSLSSGEMSTISDKQSSIGVVVVSQSHAMEAPTCSTSASDSEADQLRPEL